MTALVCPRRTHAREGGSEVRSKTDRVPSREALARRVLSSLANCMDITTGEEEEGRKGGEEEEGRRRGGEEEGRRGGGEEEGRKGGGEDGRERGGREERRRGGWERKRREERTSGED